MSLIESTDLSHVANLIKEWGKALGFQDVGICDIDLSQHEAFLQAWLDKKYYGTMGFFPERGMMRARPEELVPGTCRIISVRMDYLPPNAQFSKHLADTKVAYISRYALGRDYHKVMRKRLKQLGDKIQSYLTAHFASQTAFAFRPFVDSAPVLEHAVAEKAGIGFTGKHSLTINPASGSWFFLGELFINLPLPVDTPIADNCGTCSACQTICPTQAIVDDYVIDARKCISYLTIEHNGPIPLQFRQPMGNRIYGCDDCQLVCPFNRVSSTTQEADFLARPALFGASLIDLFGWSETQFLDETAGSPIRRIGYVRWQRNLSVGLGNAPYDPAIKAALSHKIEQLSREQFAQYGFASNVSNADKQTLLEHLEWALNAQHKPNRQQQRLIRVIQKGPEQAPQTD